MTLKRFTLVFALLALLTAGVSAHDDAGAMTFSRLSIRHKSFAFANDNPILLAATGLEAEALRAALMDGASIAELIEANEGDVAAVIADMKAQATDAINARTTSFLEELAEQVGEEMNASHARRGFWGRRGFKLPRHFAYAGVSDTIMEATGLDAARLRSALAEGETLAELVEANDSDVASVSSSIVAAITDAVNDAAAERLEYLESDISAAFNTDFAEKLRRWRRLPKPRGFFNFWGQHDQTNVANGASG